MGRLKSQSAASDGGTLYREILYLVIHTTIMCQYHVMFERCLYFNSNSLARKLHRHWGLAFRPYDLSPSHGYLLRVVLSNPGSNQHELATEMHLKHSTITRFLNNLERKDLVQRRLHPLDPRVKIIVPTQLALELEQKLQALEDQLYQEMCEKFGPEKVSEMTNNMRELSSAF